MILRYLAALATTLLAYAIYAALLAPFVEGTPGESTAGPVLLLDSRPATDIKQELAGLIPSDGWEWGTCNILESPQAILLFKTHEVLDDGSVQLEPLTMVLTPSKAATTGTGELHNGAATPRAQPVVLRAPRGAKLKFEKALSLSSDLGTLENGQLRGEVQIFRPSSGPDCDDALSLVTTNVQISPERIFTLYDCQFRFGQSFGRGKRLTIDLFGPASRQDSHSSFAGIERIELGSVDELFLHRSPSAVTPKQDSQATDLLDGANDSLWIGCAGPMNYDFTSQRATFSDDIVIRTADGQNQLNCEDLTVFLNAVESADATTSKKLKKLEVQRLQATGAPVVLTSVSQNAQLTAESIDYNLDTSTVVLSSRQTAVLVRNGQQIHSPHIQYTFTEDGRVGTAMIQGPGMIKQLADETQGSFVCRWQDKLTLQDYENGQKVLAMDHAVAELTDMQLNADQLHVWMWEVPETTPDGKTRYRLAPAKMLAEGLVKIKSPKLEGDCSEAAAFWPEPFRPVASFIAPAELRVTVRRAPQQREPVLLNQGTQSENNAHSAAAGKTRFVGRQVQLQMLGGPDPGAIDEITVDGDVVVQQQQFIPDGQFNTVLELRGQQLRGVTRGGQQNRLYISGTPSQPATVTAREIALSGGEIHLDQLANRLWIDGPGEMQLTPEERPSIAQSVSTGAAAAGSKPEGWMSSGITTVQWAGGMVFDGEKLYFETDVQSHSRQTSSTDSSVTTTTTTSAALSILLNQRIDFQQASEANKTNNLKVDKLVMVGWMEAGQAAFPGTHQANKNRQVWIAAGKYDSSGTLVSNQELYSPRTTFDVNSGDANCLGRGTVIVRQLAKSTSTNAPTASLASSGKRSGPIDFIRVDFEDSFTGNIENRKLSFHGNVHTLYTDSLEWGDVPTDAELRNPERRGMMLDCDELVLAQWTPGGGNPVVDMTATGNARVKGSQFDATAERISYFEGNGLVTVEAPTRGDAEFWFQQPDRPNRGHLIAKRIVYNLTTGTYEVDQMKQMDYSQER